MAIHLYPQCPYVTDGDTWLFAPYDHIRLLDCEPCRAVALAPSLTDDAANPARLVWHIETGRRQRLRLAILEQGFERIEEMGGWSWSRDHLLASYDETYVGDLGTVTVSWNRGADTP